MNVSPLGHLRLDARRAPFPAQRCPVSSGQLLTACRLAWEQGGSLVALWASDERDRDRGFRASRPAARRRRPHAARAHAARRATRATRTCRRSFPRRTACSARRSISSASPCDADDQRPWLWQAAGRSTSFRCAAISRRRRSWEPGQEDYPFVRVAGDGVHEIPVGPVHAGHHRARAFPLPGRRRESAAARGAPRLHAQGHREALRGAVAARRAIVSPARISGDSTVAYAWAYAQAVEAIAASRAPAARAVAARALPRARAHRQSPRRPGLSRQRRRIRVRPRAVLAAEGGRAARSTRRAFGHRLLMDVVVPGGVARDLAPDRRGAMRAQCAALEREVALLRDIYDEHAGLQDRFRGCGDVTRRARGEARPDRARRPRAAALADDLRCDFPAPPYDTLGGARGRRTPTATSPRASRCASTRSVESLRLIDAMLDVDARRRHRGDAARTRRVPARDRLRRGLARAGAGRARERARTARSVAAIRTIRRGRTGRCSSTR